QITAAGGGLDIRGPGASKLTVTRDGTAGAFRIFDSTALTLSLSNMTIAGVNFNNSNPGAALNLTNTVITTNTATASQGGGVFFGGSSGYANLNGVTL